MSLPMNGTLAIPYPARPYPPPRRGVLLYFFNVHGRRSLPFLRPPQRGGAALWEFSLDNLIFFMLQSRQRG